jgi:galactosamine-6-phosphate isomerase
MELKIFDDNQSLSAFVAGEIIETVKRNPASLLCMATGDSPLLSYQMAGTRAHESNADFSNTFFIALDEWIGVSPDDPGSCSFFLRKHVVEKLLLKHQNVHLFNGTSLDPAADCRSADAFIRTHGPIDLMVVGIGMNGHVGFNEPGTSEALYSHVIELDEVTRSVGQKYFTGVKDLGKGITLGWRHIFGARKVLLIASGKHKANIVARSLQGIVSPEIPASLLRKHPGAVFCTDHDAASELKLDD